LNPRSPGPQPGALDHLATLTIKRMSIIVNNGISFNDVRVGLAA
jgi:hypothetical protein